MGQRRTPYKTAKEYLDAVKAGGPNKFKMGGTGSKQEDQIITVAIEKATGVKFTYVPFKGGGDVAVQLVGKHIDSTRQQSDRGGGAVARRQAAAAVRVRRRSACRTRRRSPTTMSWNDIPTCKEAGVPIDYVMLRGIFMPAGVSQGAGRFLRRPVQEGARDAGLEGVHGRGRVQPTFMTGAEYAKWVEKAENTHKELMKEAGLPGQAIDRVRARTRGRDRGAGASGFRSCQASDARR